MASSGEVYQIQPMSRIPTRKTTYTNFNHHGTTSHLDHLSPLEKLRLDYQEKLLIEKEKKMSSMYERRHDEALAKVRKYSGKRNYPDARYMNGSSGINGNVLNERKSPKGTSYSNLYKKRMVVSAKEAQDTHIRRPQKLPPIDNVKKSRSYHSISHGEKMTYSNPQHHHSQSDHISRRIDDSHLGQLDTVDENIRSSPPPNTQHLRLLRERRLRQRKLTDQMANTLDNNVDDTHGNAGLRSKRKLTDFEKWQQEQDNERFARLQRHDANHNTSNGAPDENHNLSQVNRAPHKPVGRTRQNMTDGNSSINSIAPTVRSKSPEIQRETTKAIRKREILRQAVGKTSRIAELEQEILKKQLDLRRIQERDNTLHSASSGDNFTEGNTAYYEDFQLSNSYAPISKPVKVSSKRPPHDFSSSQNLYNDEQALLAFQNKPVLVRRDGSQGSSRGDSTPQSNKRQKTKKSSNRPHNNKSTSRILNGGQNTLGSDSSYMTGYTNTSAYPIDSIREEEKDVVLNLVSCNICGRKFSDDRLAMHRKICVKNQGKKRKVFDMTKARTQGTDAEKFVRRKALKRSRSPPVKKSDWRRKHEDFINAIQSAKLASQHLAKGGKLSDLPPPPPSENPDYVKCQYCQRRFNPTVAERHIPRCKDIKARPKPPKKK